MRTEAITTSLRTILTIANEYYVIYIGQCEGMLVYAKVTGLD